MRLRFATSNPAKFREASEAARPLGVVLEWERGFRKIEIQADDPVEVVKHALEVNCVEGVVIEDDALFIDALNGFPGPYSEYVYRTIGLRGVLKLLEGVEDRRARFVSAMGVCVGGKIIVATGVVEGFIAKEPRGSQGFGYDPIFVPAGYSETFAEMGPERKIQISHRTRALRALIGELMRLNITL